MLKRRADFVPGRPFRLRVADGEVARAECEPARRMTLPSPTNWRASRRSSGGSRPTISSSMPHSRSSRKASRRLRAARERLAAAELQGAEGARGGGRRSQGHRPRCLTRRRRRRTICWPRRETGATPSSPNGPSGSAARVGGRTGAALAYALRTPGKRVRAALVFCRLSIGRRRVARDRRRCRGGRDGAHLLAGARRSPLHGRRRSPPRPSDHPPRSSTCPPRRGWASCSCPWRRGCSPRPRRSWVSLPPRWAAWPRSSSRPAASREWWGAVARSRGRAPEPRLSRELIGRPSGKDRRADPGLVHPGRALRRRRAAEVVKALGSVRRGHRPRLPDRGRRARRHRHE